MRHTIVRNIPLSIAVASVLFSSVLSVALAQTPERVVPSVRPDMAFRMRAATSTDARTPGMGTTTRWQRPFKGMDEKRKAFLMRAAELRANPGEWKAELQKHKGDRQGKLSDQSEKGVRVATENIRSRLNHALEKLTSLTDRVDARAHVLQAQGTNVDAVLTLIAMVRNELKVAGSIINDDLASEVDTAVVSDEPKIGFSYVKESIREAMDHVRTAQKGLRDAVGLLQGGKGDRDQEERRREDRSKDAHASSTEVR